MKTLPSSLSVALLSAALFLGQAARGDEPAAAEPLVPDRVIYLAKLPAPGDLVKSAEARGTTIERMDQTSTSITVAYVYSGGRKSTLAYTLLSAAATGDNVVTSSAAPAPAPANSTVVYTTAPTPEVVYVQQPAPVYYETRYVRTYDPAWDWVAPLAVGVGLGWVWHGGHGGHGGWHGGHGGGWHHH